MSWKKKTYKYQTKEAALAAVSAYGHALKDVPPALSSDKDVVLAAVRRRGFSLGYATGTALADRDVCVAACSNDWWALQSVSDDLRGDKKVRGAACEFQTLARLWHRARVVSRSRRFTPFERPPAL